MVEEGFTMIRKHRIFMLSLLALLITSASVYALYSWQAIPVKDDPLVRMPGTQPGQVNLESPDRCLNCHANYKSEVEPGFNWQGSMMAQSARDFLFWSCMTVAGQDAIWALGTPNAMDICERCHFPKGWLEGRSDPTNVSLMTGADYDGVQCDFCHRMYDPFFESTTLGTREGNDWLNYWDETNGSGTPSQLAADAAYQEDSLLALGEFLFNGDPFFSSNLPFSPNYTENASGQYFVSPNNQKRAPFADHQARHQVIYSRYHKSKYFCASCHDVSNPLLANLGADPSQPLPTELNPAYSYFHVERTFSEFMLSAYGQQGGTAGIGPFAPGFFDTSYPANTIAKCQDCHMRDVVGAGADKSGVPIRPGDSVEHPNSGQPLHDLTGGNAWVSYILASAVAGSPVYDPINDQLLNPGTGGLTLDLTQGLGIDSDAMLAGVDRAKQQLQLAASIQNLSYNPTNGNLSFRVQNQTGHKLLSGFPEGRRAFVNIRVYSGGNLIFEVNPYDHDAGTLKGLDYTYTGDLPVPDPLTSVESYVDELVYEIHPSSTITGEDETFHVALADGRYKDNRIPPMGFRIGEASERLVQPVWHGQEMPGYFSAEEYAGGYDEVNLADFGVAIPGADLVEVRLYYQTTSREYIQFLRDEINGTASTLPGSAYIIQSDSFFVGLKDWGETIWKLWTHNMNLPGAAPFLMAGANVGSGGGCSAPTPTLEPAVPGHQQVTLNWSDEHTVDTDVVGYKVYYDQGGKAQLVRELGLVVSFTDIGLGDGQEYCYKVSSLKSGCESTFSNVQCGITNNQPSPLSDPSPEDGAVGVPVNTSLSWYSSDPDPGDTLTYDVYLEANDNTPDTLVCNDTTSRTCAWPGDLVYDTQYYWRVVARDKHGATASGTWSFKTPSPPPAPGLVAPSGLIGNGTPTFRWNESIGATAYRMVVYSMDAGSTVILKKLFASQVCSGGVCEFTPSEPLVQGAYRFRMSGINEAGWGKFSTWMFFSYFEVPSAPTLISPTGKIGEETPTYTWDAVDFVKMYKLMVYSIDRSTYVVTKYLKSTDICSGGVCVYTSTSSLSEENYRFRVRAYNQAGWGPFSTWKSFEVVIGLPSAPTLIQPSGVIGDSTPTYKWNKVDVATVYKVSLYSETASSYVFNQNVTASSVCGASVCAYTPSTPLVQGSYRFKVSGHNAVGWGPASVWMAFRYGTPAAPVLISPSGTTSDTTPTYKWNQSDGATRYKLMVYSVASSSNVVIANLHFSGICSGGVCSYTPPTTLSPGDYRFKLRAYNRVGWGPVSPWMRFTISP
jgi:hypothetical protein